MQKQFTNYPKKIDISYYYKVREELVAYYKAKEDVLAVYEYGTVKAPGISDIDIILVLKDHINLPPEKLELEHVSQEAHDLLIGGTLMKMTPELLVKIRFLDDINVHKISGRDISLEEPSEEDKKYIQLVSLIDWLPERMLRLIKINSADTIDIMSTLCVLNSFSYSLSLAQSISGKDDESQQFIAEVKHVRSNWFSTENPEEKVLQLVKKSIALGYKSLNAYESFLKKTGDYLTTDFSYDEEIRLALFKGRSIVFTHKKREDVEKYTLGKSAQQESVVYLSHFFYPHFAFYAQQQGILSSTMKKKLQPLVSIEENILNKEYTKNLQRKWNIAEQNALFLNANDIKKGLIRFGFYFTE